MTYQANEFTFDLPEDFKDKTMHVFSLTDQDPSEFSLVVTRGPLAKDETLQSYGQIQLEQFKKTLADFQLVREHELIVSGTVPATFMDFTWSSNGKPVNQRQLSFLWFNAARNEQNVVMLTGTCKDRFTPKWAQVFEDVVSSIRPRQ